MEMMQTTTSNSNLYQAQLRSSVENDNQQINRASDLFSINKTVGQFGVPNNKGYHREWHIGDPLALDTYKEENIDLKMEPELSAVPSLGYMSKSPSHAETQCLRINAEQLKSYRNKQYDVTKSQLDGFKDLASSPPIYTSKNIKASCRQDGLPAELSSERTPSPATSLSASYTETERGANYNNLYSQEDSNLASSSSLSSEQQSTLEEDKKSIYR